MARYIDADKFKYSLELSIKSWSRDFNSKAPTITTTYKEVLHRLENMKTADVVEVVRCEECKCLMKEIVVEQTPYGFENEKIGFGCQRILDLTGEWVDVMLDDFCSYGTPKERGGEK